MKYVKKVIGSYNLHMIHTDRFKTVNIELIFSNQIKKEEITMTNFLASILAYSTKKYPTKNSLAVKMQDLYAVRIFPSCYRIGNLYNIDFNISMLDEKYSEKGMLDETLELLKSIVFDPNVENNSFDLDSFNVVRNEEKSQIERIREDSRKYSIIKMLNYLNKDSIFSYNGYGYLEDLEKITPQNLYEYYKRFISSSNIDIFIVGNIDFDYVYEIVKNKFSFGDFERIKRNPFLKIQKPREKEQIVFEADNTNQAKLSIGCLIDNMTKFEREYVLNAYNLILGATSDSKFFKNIREKYSVCYYISSVGNKLDNLLLINSGISKNNFEITFSLIKKEMEDMCKGIFSDLELENVKKYYVSSLEELEDRPNQIISSYYAMDLLGVDDLEKRKNMIMKVTREDIVKLANKIKIDTVFLLGGDKNDKKRN